MKHAIITRWFAYPSWGRSQFPHDFGIHSHSLSKLTIKGHGPLQLCWLYMESTMVDILSDMYSNLFPTHVFVRRLVKYSLNDEIGLSKYVDSYGITLLILYEFALVTASHDCFLGVHMNKHTLLNCVIIWFSSV